MTDAAGNPLVALVRAHESLDELAAAINASHAQALAAFDKGIEAARQTGELLKMAKQRCGHGEWIPWVTRYCSFGRRQASKYMRLATRWQEVQTARMGTGSSHLGIDRALAILTEPEPDKPQSGICDAVLATVTDTQMGIGNSHLAPDTPPTTRPLEPDEYVPQWGDEGNESKVPELIPEPSTKDEGPEQPADVPVTNAVLTPPEPAPSASWNRSPARSQTEPDPELVALAADVTKLAARVTRLMRSGTPTGDKLALYLEWVEAVRKEERQHDDGPPTWEPAFIQLAGFSWLIELAAQPGPAKNKAAVKREFGARSGGVVPWFAKRRRLEKQQRAEGGS